jgi:hypothetical protein
MALGLGDGGEQNAPLGRPVIGGFDLRYYSYVVFCAHRRGCLRLPETGGRAGRPATNQQFLCTCDLLRQLCKAAETECRIWKGDQSLPAS